MPPGSQGRNSLMSPGEVWLVRAGPLLFLVAGVVVILFAGNLTAGLFLLLPLGGYRQLPAHQRRQVLGR